MKIKKYVDNLFLICSLLYLICFFGALFTYSPSTQKISLICKIFATGWFFLGFPTYFVLGPLVLYFRYKEVGRRLDGENK